MRYEIRQKEMNTWDKLSTTPNKCLKMINEQYNLFGADKVASLL